MRQVLRFRGRPMKGAGRFAREPVLPGRLIVPNAPIDWPMTLASGTFNLFIIQYPDNFDSLGPDDNTKKFDSGLFAPAFSIPAEMIEGNTLPPIDHFPQRGTGQAWEAIIYLPNGKEVPCWMFRRIGSNMPDRIELVSHENIRKTYDIPEDSNIEVTLDIFEGL